MSDPLEKVTNDVRQKEQNAGGLVAVRHLFHAFAQRTSSAVGTPWSFMIALAIVIVWAATGPMFHYSDTWQLVINTGTTIVTFLMVFLIQNTQNRDAKALHLKLDELIRSKRGARNKLVDLEDCTDEELEEIEREFKHVRSRAIRHPERADRHGSAESEAQLHPDQPTPESEPARAPASHR